MPEKTAALIYLLMRDHLPVAVVTRLVGEAQMQTAYEPELGALAYRLGNMLDDDGEPEAEPEAEAGELADLQPIMASDDGGFNTFDGSDLSDAMVDWLDLFDDRIRSDPFFVEAVNDAVEAGRATSDDTARLVAGRVSELREAREARREK